MGDRSKTVDWIDRTATEVSTSKRLQQAASSLEAEYAVLSEANAKSAELEALLRNSQPLVWLDNALALQRDKAPATRKSTQQRRSIVGNTHIAYGAGFVDDDGALDELFLESDRRRQRRVQWEVAKRIARVQQEITRQPTAAQRPWHVREKKRLEEEEKRRHEERLAKEKQRRQEERDERVRVENDKKVKHKRAAPKRITVVPRQVSTISDPVNKPPPKGDIDLDMEWPTKPKKPVPVHLEPDSSHDEKENLRAMPSPLLTEKSPVVPTPREQANLSDARLLEMVRESLEDALPVKATDSKVIVPREVDAGDGHAIGDWQPSQEIYSVQDRANATHTTSSLGRQVLSEHRTMPTTVSFGVPVLTGSRLNSDALRRLFSDLDSDHDGHVNRLEMSLALHRLQIHVPAPRIVAFFKRIHAMQDANELQQRRGPRSHSRERVRTHEPLKEVINYKQFVAFVTTAFDQQKQQQLKQQAQTRDTKPHLDDENFVRNQSPSLSPSQAASQLALPLAPAVAIESPVRRRLPFSLRTDEYDAEDQPRRVVEQHGDGDDEDDVAGRVLRQLPDILMARALAAAEAPPSEANLQQIVRQSLEKLGKGSPEDAIVDDVTRDLVRKYAKKVLSARHADGAVDADEIDDVSGLRRAALFFDSLGVHDASADTTLLFGVEEEASLADWWSVLTEEQVASLVQEIWTQRQRVAAPLTVSQSEQAKSESPLVIPSPTPSLQAPAEKTPGDSDQETHRSPVVESPAKDTAHVQRVAEKAIQTVSIESMTSILSPPPPPPPPEDVIEETSSSPQLGEEPTVLLATRTTLARALLDETNSDVQVERRPQTTASRTKEILANLRRQRRRHQVTMSVSTSAESVAESVASASIDESAICTNRIPTTSHVPSTFYQPQTLDQNTQRIEVDEQKKRINETMASAVDTAPSPLPTREVRLHPTAVGPITSSDLVRSSSFSRASSSDIFSSYGSSLRSSSFQLLRELSGDDVWRYAAQRRRQRLAGRRHRQRNQSEVYSSGHGSLDGEADLSEGEIVLDAKHDDLSDGELFGGTRRKIVRAKNARVANVSGSVHSDDANVLRSSVGSLESGEMMPSMIAVQRSYHQRLVHSSVSSFESGEAEDGVVANS